MSAERRATPYYADCPISNDPFPTSTGVCVPLVGLPSLVRTPVTKRISRSLTAGRSGRVMRFLFVTVIALAAIACGNLPKGNEPGSEPPPGITPVDPVTQAGHATLNLYLVTFVIAVIVFVIVEGL